MLRRDRERLGKILGRTRRRLGQGVVVEQVGSVSVNQSAATGGGGASVRERAKRKKKAKEERTGDAQCEPVLPAPGKVFDVDFVVRRSLALTPQQQPFFGVRAFFAVGAGGDRSEKRSAFRRCRKGVLLDVGDREAEDETPDHAEDEFAVPVDDVFGPDVGQMDAHLFDPLERLDGVLHLLHAMIRVQVVPTKRRVGQDFLYDQRREDSASSARCPSAAEEAKLFANARRVESTSFRR